MESKAYSSRSTAITIKCWHTGMPGTTQTFKPCAANPPGAELVTRRRTVQVTEPIAPQRPHTAR